MIDRHSDTWAAVVAEIARRREDALRRLLRPGLDPVATEYCRGVLAALDALEALADEKPAPGR